MCAPASDAVRQHTVIDIVKLYKACTDVCDVRQCKSATPATGFDIELPPLLTRHFEVTPQDLRAGARLPFQD